VTPSVSPRDAAGEAAGSCLGFSPTACASTVNSALARCPATIRQTRSDSWAELAGTLALEVQDAEQATQRDHRDRRNALRPSQARERDLAFGRRTSVLGETGAKNGLHHASSAEMRDTDRSLLLRCGPGQEARSPPPSRASRTERDIPLLARDGRSPERLPNHFRFHDCDARSHAYE
jgi:hypothetical protein